MTARETFLIHDDERGVDHDDDCLAAWRETPTAGVAGPLSHCRHGTWMSPDHAAELAGDHD